MDQKTIGAFIRRVRKENGLTQEQLAEKLGVSQKSVSRWETGKTMPDYSLLPGICETLNINVAELLGAERIEGDTVPKKQVTVMAHSMIALMDDKKFVRKIIGAVLSAVIMLVCALALYSYEFNVCAESTADLEQAINEYHFEGDVSADILERKAIGNRLFVLYGENEYPGACGLACLEKGLFGKYRIISCEDYEYRWVNVSVITVGKTRYCVTYCVNDFPGIDSYGICGITEETGPNLTADESYLLFKTDYMGSPFLSFTEIENDVEIYLFDTKYYRNGTEIRNDELETVLGAHNVDGAPNSGTWTAELGFIYVLEGIIILVGIIFIRYFLTDADGKRKEK